MDPYDNSNQRYLDQISERETEPKNYDAPEVQRLPYYQNKIPAYQNIPPQPYQNLQYSQPAVASPPVIAPVIIINQPIMNQNIKVRKTPLKTFCPFCKTSIVTLMKPEFNMRACCVFFCTCGIIFTCIQLVNNKDLTCYDYIHICPKCGNIIGKYFAM